jgi:hypothetical protein
MSGHICVGCKGGQAQIREKRGNRLRFCGDVCQAAFYEELKVSRIGVGLLNAVSDTPAESLRQDLENTFRPYAGPELPLALANALAQVSLPEPDGSQRVSVQRVWSIYTELFGQGETMRPDFLGWHGDALMTAVFGHGLDQEFGSVATILIRLAGVDQEPLWGISLYDDEDKTYDAQHVASIFARLGTKSLEDRVDIVRSLSAEPALLAKVYIHFARQLMRLAVGTNDVRAFGAVTHASAPDAYTLRTVITTAAEMGSDLVFRQAVEQLKKDKASGRAGPGSEALLALATTLARANNWT